MKKGQKVEIPDNYVFDGIRTKKAQNKIIKLLKSCKEIRDTAYPLKDSAVTELTITELHAHKQKDYTYITGSLHLEDKNIYENRTFEAYITSKEGEDHVLLDITRIAPNQETNMIRTTDIIKEDENNIISITSYCGIGFLQEKVFSSEFPKNSETFEVQPQQLSVL